MNQNTIPGVIQPEEPMSFELEELLHVLGHGPDNAKSRKMLTQQMDMSDRKVRRLISEARQRGIFILNRCDGTGYYIVSPDDYDSEETQDDIAYTDLKNRGGRIAFETTHNKDNLDALERMYNREFHKAASIFKMLEPAKRILRANGRTV